MASAPFVGGCPEDGQLDVVDLRLLREVHDERRSVLDLEDFVNELQAIIKNPGYSNKKIIYQPQTVLIYSTLAAQLRLIIFLSL